ncbi:MAG: mandelate racemase/muconate lactonizing enzyme family protein [Oscillospiraceae bacterium]|nr:mandelate racemase/muconate lactonizing enzyme family protein [Oscillospiraceae bacterium]
MSNKIKAVEVFSPIFRAEDPPFDSSFILKYSGNVVVRVIAEDGTDGFGVTFGEPVAEYIKMNLIEEVVGKDPLANEDIWNDMFRAIRSSGRKGAALLGISAIDIAIWDLRGKILGQPIYKLLGGTKRKIPAYASVGFLSMPDDEVVERSLIHIADGYKTLKVKVGYDNGENIKADVNRLEKVRHAVGSDIELIVDANGIYDCATAIRFLRAADGVGICLFEEPVHADDIAGLRRVRDTALAPVASGENEYTKYGCRDLLIAEAVDVLQFDITRVGGFTEMVKVSAMVQAWNLKIAPHFWPQISAHMMSPAPHGLYLEVFPTIEGSRPGGDIITNQPPIIDGYYELPASPGLGLEFDIDFLTRHKVN